MTTEYDTGTERLVTAPARHWAVEIGGILSTANAYLAASPWKRRREKAFWRQWAMQACRAAGVPPLGRARVTLTRYAPGSRLPDTDGIAGGGAKHLLDGLVDAGVIDDDDVTHLAVAYRAERCPTVFQARTVLVIERWDGAR